MTFKYIHTHQKINAHDMISTLTHFTNKCPHRNVQTLCDTKLFDSVSKAVQAWALDHCCFAMNDYGYNIIYR